MPSKYVDTVAIMQVVGSVFISPQLLDFTDKYCITEEDFPEQFHKIVFGSIYKLHELGANKITLENIADFLSSRKKNEAVYYQNKGEEWLTKVSHSCNLMAFDYYYNRLKKFSLLRAYDNCGIDITDIYDIDNIMDTKKKQLQEEQLDNMTLAQIAVKVDEKIDRIKMQYVDNTFGHLYKAGDNIDELLEDLEKHPDVGIPLYGPLINTVTRGARLRKMYLRSAPSGFGKAIPNNTIIPTPIGYRKVEDIRPGDYLFGQDGRPTKVLKIFPQPEEKEVYEITFSDGRKAKCCEDHLWEYRYQSHRDYRYRVESVKQILTRVEKLKNGLRNSDTGYRFAIKTTEPVEYPKRQYKLSPYAMGALLGDGSFRYNESQKALGFSSNDDELPNIIATELGEGYYALKRSDLNYNYSFKHINNSNHNLWVEEVLSEHPDLWNKKSEDKYIPVEYLTGSVSQRYELLQGLMDTDGSIDLKGRTSFTTISPRLRDNVIELCHSLGMLATWTLDNRPEKYTTGECYHITIQAKKHLKQKMFRLTRKVQRAKNYAENQKREEFKDHISIVSIEKLEYKTSMTCFTVDNTDHLFLMNDYIVTHNTRTMVADVCYIGCNKIYDDSFGWINNGNCEPVLYITTEQELGEIQTLMLAFLSNVDEEHILNNKYEGDEKERVAYAKELIKQSSIYVVELPDFSLQDVENIIKQSIRDNDVRYVAFDYIMSSLKILEEIAGRSGGIKLREDNILFMMSRRLKDIANEYGVFILSGTQLNGSWKEEKIPDQNMLRGAKSIADSIDLGMHILPVTQEDLESLKPILDTNTFEVPNTKLAIYKNRRGRYKSVYLWCKSNLGTCRVRPMYCTDFSYELIDINDLKIQVEKGAF